MNRIATLRKSAGISQEKLANMIGVKQNTLSNYENGKSQPPWDIVKKLADIFGTTLDYLLCITDVPPEKAEAEMLKNLHYRSLQLGSEEQEILRRLNALNIDGVERLMEYAEFLLNSDKYRKTPGTASPGD